eukprot:3260837-Amphidinium_carterae.1
MVACGQEPAPVVRQTVEASIEPPLLTVCGQCALPCVALDLALSYMLDVSRSPFRLEFHTPPCCGMPVSDSALCIAAQILRLHEGGAQIGAVNKAWHETVLQYSSCWPKKIRAALRLEPCSGQAPINMRSLVTALSAASVHSSSFCQLQKLPSEVSEFSLAAWPLLVDFVGLHVDVEDDFGMYDMRDELQDWQLPFAAVSRELLQDA